jgi:TRAP transporter TAXI family solute receptor
MKKIILLFSFILLLNHKSLSQTTLSLATGPEGGVYFSIGIGLKAAIEKACPDVTIALNPTEGSIENSWKLSNNEVQLALVQSDVAAYFREGKRMFRYPSESMMAIATLYPEVVHLVVRKDVGINSIDDLKGKVVAVGKKNSGTIYNSLDILDYFELTDKVKEKKYLSFSETDKAFKNKSIDASFYTSGVPSDAIKDLSSLTKIIGFDSLSVEGILERYSYFQKSSISANNYPDQNNNINSVGVNVILAVQKNSDRRLIKRITDAIFTNLSELEKSHIVAKNINLENSYKINALDLHPGASEFYKDSERIERQFKDYFLDWFSYALLIALILYSLYHHKKFRYNFSRNQYFQIAVILGFLFTVGTFGTYWFERSVNKNFDNIIDTFWTTIIYLLSGFEGNNPITVGGKISSVFILLGSVALLGSVIGHFTSIFIRESKKKMPVDLKKHIAICYWSCRGDTIVKELRHSEKASDKEIIILHDSDPNEKELRSKNNYYKNVFFIEGDPTNTKALEDSRTPFAESVIILAGENHENSDPLTILTCLSIEKLCKRLKVEKPHIIAELMNRDNRQIAIEAGADEIVSAGYYRTGIMLQSALYPQLSDIYHELLSYGENKTSVYIIDEKNYSKSLEGKTFKEIVDIINKNRDEDNPIILLGIKRNKNMILNPQESVDKSSAKYFDNLKGGDSLVVIAQKYPNLQDINL